MIGRRGFLGGLLALVAAPFVKRRPGVLLWCDCQYVGWYGAWSPKTMTGPECPKCGTLPRHTSSSFRGAAAPRALPYGLSKSADPSTHGDTIKIRLAERWR